jgi:hypothetical protein
MRALLLAGALALISCASSTSRKPPVSDAQLISFAQDYKARLSGDPEFASGLVTDVIAHRQGSHAPLVVLRLDGRQWVVPGQKDRLLRKASLVLVEACRPYQAGHGSVCSVQFVDNLGTMVGFGVAGGTNPDQYQYRIVR